jgi:uncharacterized protein (DUF488 family)
MSSAIPVFSIGFTKKNAAQFFESLRAAGVAQIIDVRLNKSSQLAGFSKAEDLKYFLRTILNVDYLDAPLLAPTQEMLDSYRKKQASWDDYQKAFLRLMQEREIEKRIDPATLAGGCLLCSEDQPHRCHRRLVLDYLNERWGNLLIRHLT